MIVHCPACSKKMSLPDSASGKTYRCPHCQERLTVPSPIAAEPAPIIQPADSEVERKQSYRKREPMSGQSKLFVLVVIMGAIVLGFLIYDRVEAYYVKKRVQYLVREAKDARRRIMIRAAMVRTGEVQFANRLDFPDRPLPPDYASDAEMVRLFKRLDEVAAEADELERKYPEITKQAVREMD